jgi:hypothetical protein
VQGCTRDQYRELVQPTDVPKRHALVLEDDNPIAAISLRRRNQYWEPVTYQALPGAIAPATDHSALGRALNALGIEVRVSAGLAADAYDLNARHVFPYEAHQVALKTDYEAHWRQRSTFLRDVRRARKKCADMDVRIDGDGDLEWIVTRWQEMWADNPEQETVATPDRLRFWKAVARGHRRTDEFGINTVQLVLGDKRIAGAVYIRHQDTVIQQCQSRTADYEDSGVGTRTVEASVEWAVSAGLSCLDLGGGEWKKRWGPATATRYAAQFRPLIINSLRRVYPD